MKFNRNVVRVALIGIVVGIALVSAGTATFHAFGSTQFCGEFCHTMDGSYVAYKKGLHGKTYSGFEVSCSECHLKYGSEKSVSQGQVLAMIWHKATSGLSSLIGQVKGDYATPELWKKQREETAKGVTQWMISTGFRNCLACHNLDNMKNNSAKPVVAPMHKALAKAKNVNCILCHAKAGHDYD